MVVHDTLCIRRLESCVLYDTILRSLLPNKIFCGTGHQKLQTIEDTLNMLGVEL